MQCHIQVNNLALSYRWKTFQKHIFQNLNLCIPHGDFVTLIGGNGSGKSSLVKLILGLVTPQAGEVLVDDVLVRPGYPEALKANRIAYLSQQIEELFFSETVGEELRYHGGDPDQNQQGALIGALGLDVLMDRRVESLSGGERQSLALGQFMVSEAPLLILDEPSSYLDEMKASILKTYLENAHHRGKTILHVTQFAAERKWGSHVIDLDAPSVQLTAL